MPSKKCHLRPSFGDLCANSERYVILLTFEDVCGATRESSSSFLQEVFTNLSQINHKSDKLSIPQRRHRFAIVDPASCQNTDADWLTVDDLHTGSASTNGRRASGRVDGLPEGQDNSDKRETDEINTGGLDVAFSEAIHALADKLPLTGHYLDIIWLTTTSTDVPITSHISLYGALQRLCSWHAGLLTVVCEDATPDKPLNDTLNEWVNHLQGRVVRGGDWFAEAVGQGMAWRGEVTLADGKGQKSLCIPGLVLSSRPNDDSAIQVSTSADTSTCLSPQGKPSKSHAAKKIVTFSRQLEVVCSVRRADVPSIFVSPLQFSLHCLPSSRLPRSEHFLHWLREISQSHDSTVIMRLPCRTLTPNTRSNRNARPISTKAWKEHVKTCAGDLKVPDLHLHETQEFFYLLVHCDGKHSQDLVAQVMYSPRDLSGDVHAQLAEYQQSLTFDDLLGAGTTLKTVPSLEGHQVQTLLETIKLAQAEAIKAFLEERKSEGREPAMTIGELQQLMGTVYSIAMAEMGELSKTNKVDDDNDVEEDLRNENVISELDCSPSGWLQKLALQNHEALERKIKRFKSGEMMLAGMAVPAPADNTITLTAEEFLKHFLASGLPSTEDLSPISMALTSRADGVNTQNDCPGLSWDDLKKATFEQAQKYTHAGIQYFSDSGQSQKMDTRFSKMQQRYIRYETASTCSSDQAASPATLTLPQPSTSTTDPASDTVHPTSDTSETKGNPQRNRQNARGQRSAEKTQRSAEKGQRAADKGQRLMRLQRSAEKRRRMVLERNHKISPGRPLVRGLKRKGEVTVSPAKKRLVPTRTSPRKKVTPSVAQQEKPLSAKTNKESSQSSSTSSSKSRTMSRSEKTRMKLREVVKESLAGRGITKESKCYKACMERLYRMAEMYVKDLKSSKGLDEQMKSIAEANADFVVQFEQNRIKNA
ncbi:mdm2-binding protein-like [Patiria miniata]|uniref:Mdm2-binding protein n=1 Tax=Patiria miniata TaxID=46514 RepID=A0A914AU97_PATMI|nr:mdm2-binding protein-like [Patiria miniata]